MTEVGQKERRQRRLFLLGALLVAGGALGVVAFGNVGENLVYYWDPTQVAEAGKDAVGPTIRLGGVVQEDTMDWDPDASELRFVVGDGTSLVKVHSTGAPPQMFREGIGVVVEGTMTKAGVFESRRLMVKHSNEYKAPEDGETVEDLCKNFLKQLYQLYSFQIGSERYGGPFRYLGHRAIFPTQTLRVAGIWIFSTQTVRLLLVFLVQFD